MLVTLLQDGSHSMQQLKNMYQSLVTELTNPDFYISKIAILLKIILLLVAAKLVIRFGTVALERVFAHRTVRLDERRSKTLTSLTSNILRYAVYFFVILSVLEQLDFHVETLIAGAGIAGLAIGFGAQSLVKDVITGFFIIFEDQFAVGDEIQTGNYRGTVTEIGLRVTKLRAWTGEVHIIPNGQITNVTNFSKANSLAVLDVGVAYEENIEYVTSVLQRVLQQAKDEMHSIVGDPKVLGVQNLGPSEVVIRIIAECKPTESGPVARELRRRIKVTFDEEGIEIPYPKQVLLAGAQPVGEKAPTTGLNA
jgi:moderate conductance mechanosensitive channel